MATDRNTAEFLASLTRTPGTVFPKVPLVVTGFRLDGDQGRERFVMCFSSEHGPVSCWALPSRGETTADAALRLLKFFGLSGDPGAWKGTKVTADLTVSRHRKLCVYLPAPAAPVVNSIDIDEIIAQF